MRHGGYTWTDVQDMSLIELTLHTRAFNRMLEDEERERREREESDGNAESLS